MECVMHHPQVQREHVRPDGNAASGTPCFQSILALTDLSARSQPAVERAARLAADHGALLKLMYAPASLAPLAHAEAATALAALARAMGARFDVLVKQVAISSGGLAQIVDEARHADLVVLRHERDRSPGAFFTGQPVERLLRQLRCPVLVTRLAARPRYGRILVAVDFTPASHELVSLAHGLDANAALELFHALNTMHESKLRYAEVSDHAIRTYRHDCQRQARERLFSLTDSSSARRNRVLSTIGRGDPARQATVQQQHARAELLVVGKRRAHPLADFFFGSVAQRVLCWATGDVLVVPTDRRGYSPSAVMPRKLQAAR
jgi:nucleotide-binding universal stress UspA family protein